MPSTTPSVTAKTTASQRSRAAIITHRQERNPLDISKVTWSNLRATFNELVELKETPTTGVNALEMRASHKKKVHDVIVALLDRAQSECRYLLVDGDAVAAEHAGFLLLKLREEFYGANTLELIPAYMHLARTKQFAERYGEAEDMISLAHFILLKHQDNVTEEIKAEIHQAFGLLYAADNRLDAAVQHLTRASYYLSAIHGPRSVHTTFGYFDLANVFAAKASMESAMALYDTVKEIWAAFLMEKLEEITEKLRDCEEQKKYADGNEADLVDACYVSAHEFGAEPLADASKMLHGVFSIQQERFRTAHPSPARAAYVLGLFLLWAQNKEEAAEYLKMARVESQRFYGSRHPVVQEIELWCDKFDIAYQGEEKKDEPNVDSPTQMEDTANWGDDHDKNQVPSQAEEVEGEEFHAREQEPEEGHEPEREEEPEQERELEEKLGQEPGEDPEPEQEAEVEPEQEQEENGELGQINVPEEEPEQQQEQEEEGLPEQEQLQELESEEEQEVSLEQELEQEQTPEAEQEQEKEDELQPVQEPEPELEEMQEQENKEEAEGTM